MGAPVAINGTTTAVCQRFYPTGAAIRLPADTATERFGVVQVERGSGLLTTRDGKTVPIPAALTPPAPNTGIGGRRSYAQVVYRATTKDGAITAVSPRLFVPAGTPLRPYMGTTFVGSVVNVPNPGTALTVPPSEVVRWDFGYGNVEGHLRGRFVNLTRSIREAPAGARYRSCLPALVGLDRARNDWYAPVLGTSDTISLEWDPAMHAPVDSELVVSMGSGVTFMTRSPRLTELMTGNIDVTRPVTFAIHATPFGLPATFTGSFRPWESAQFCSVRI